jgi:diaminopimelate epimerase
MTGYNAAMRFTKMHGIGNDYIYINGFQQTVDDPADLARRMADRHFGVGGDGLILILPPEDSSQADVRMRMFNADGSEAQMCGNGVRCVAKYTVDHGLADSKPLRVQTGAGVKSIDYRLDPAGRLTDATVDMGPPELRPQAIPVRMADLEQLVNHPIDKLFAWPASVGEAWVSASGLDARMTCVSMGNPHVMLYCRDVQAVPLEQVGPVIENHRLFPERINVHFVQVDRPNHVTVRHWERGSGATLACGTGACAVCVAGVLTDRTRRGIHTALPGGSLELQWRESDGHVLMTGPATDVFTGDWPDD